MQFKLPERLPPWLVVVLSLVAVAAVSVTFALVDDNGDGTPDRVTITVNTQPRDGAPTKTLSVPEAAVDQAEESLKTHDHLKLPPADAPPAQVDAAERDAQREAKRDRLVEGGATSNQRGCTTAFVRNQSSRNGVKPDSIDLHYTVGPNRPGRSDVDGYTAMANNPTSGVSWHYVIDREGYCNYNVPEDRNAWTQASHNPFAIGIEVVNTGSEGSYMDPAGYRKLALVVRDAARRWGIPLRLGAVSGCVTTRPGIIDHGMLGLCGGGHVDIRPYSISQIVAIIQRLAGATTSRLTKYERRIAEVRCDRRQAVVSAAKGSTTRRQALGDSRKARRVVRAQIRRLDQAKRSSGRPWSYRHRGVRRHELARTWMGKGCATR